MFSFLAKKKPTTAYVNAQPIAVQPKETLLQAALRQGIAFPHSCRVGGCASCKCKLVEGKVKELTETGYILSDEELDQGFILACQSVPQTDVRIEVDLAAVASRKVSGRVLAQDRLTHDITRLRIQLDEALNYRAGQFANLSLEGLSGVARSYSFATPVQPDGQVTFFVRKVPGGAFSSRINEQNVVGQAVAVEGPMGDFWLRPAQAPILAVAGGSGLAPIVALLKEALDAGVSRPVSLLFGARQQRDLYALDEIEHLARSWRGPFKFVPVLSAEPESSGWLGARGLVVDHISTVHLPDSHAYLCGPPPMVDNATALLKLQGIPAQHIHADRFSTLHDAAPAAA